MFLLLICIAKIVCPYPIISNNTIASKRGGKKRKVVLIGTSFMNMRNKKNGKQRKDSLKRKKVNEENSGKYK